MEAFLRACPTSARVTDVPGTIPPQGVASQVNEELCHTNNESCQKTTKLNWYRRYGPIFETRSYDQFSKPKN